MTDITNPDFSDGPGPWEGVYAGPIHRLTLDPDRIYRITTNVLVARATTIGLQIIDLERGEWQTRMLPVNPRRRFTRDGWRIRRRSEWTPVQALIKPRSERIALRWIGPDAGEQAFYLDDPDVRPHIPNQ